MTQSALLPSINVQQKEKGVGTTRDPSSDTTATPDKDKPLKFQRHPRTSVQVQELSLINHGKFPVLAEVATDPNIEEGKEQPRSYPEGDKGYHSGSEVNRRSLTVQTRGSRDSYDTLDGADEDNMSVKTMSRSSKCSSASSWRKAMSILGMAADAAGSGPSKGK